MGVQGVTWKSTEPKIVQIEEPAVHSPKKQSKPKSELAKEPDLPVGT